MTKSTLKGGTHVYSSNGGGGYPAASTSGGDGKSYCSQLVYEDPELTIVGGDSCVNEGGSSSATTSGYAVITLVSHELTINPNGGKWDNKTEASKKIILEGGTETIADPVRDGYTFDGWDRTGTGSSITNGTFTMGTEDATITARWTANDHTLTIDTNGGTTTDNTTQTISEGSSVTIANPTKTGYTFDGWDCTGEGSRINNGTFTMGTEDATITANWTGAEVNYTIKHYKQNLDGTYPKDATDTVTKKATTGSKVKAERKTAKEYEGYEIPDKRSERM